MSAPTDSATLNLLRCQLDELATTLLISGPDAAVLDGFRSLARSAAEHGKDGLAQAAGEVVQQVTAAQVAAAQPAAIEELLQAGFANLRATLERSGSPDGTELAASAAPVANALAQDPELVGDFINESREHLCAIETHMLTLDRTPDDLEAIHAVFRGFHTIKGLAGFLDFMPIRDLAHEVETLLDLARNAKLAITRTVVDTVLASVDFLKHAIECVDLSLSGVMRPVNDNTVLILRIRKMMAGEALAEQPSTSGLSTLACAVLSPAGQIPESVPAQPQMEPAHDGPAPASSKRRTTEAASVRVQTSKLDYLMDMVGEMVITQSLIRHNPAMAALQSTKLLSDFSQLARITSEVQRTTMGMRMITIGQVFGRSSRLVRDLSRKAGKQIELDISGEDTELDKTIAEELTDPLLHMVRNSCDHGVEEPAARRAAGKDPTARIRLAAYHQGGQIVVEISDDGRGLDREKILAKALQKGLIAANTHLSEQEIFSLIFEPGFSTAAQVTDLSGRGVGMDVVRKNILKLRGRIEIQSKVGQGTTFLLKLPLTLAIIEGLVIAVGVHRYIVPIYAVRELISPRPGTISTIQGRNETAMVRDRVLPVLRLSRRFGVVPKSEDATAGLLVVVEGQEQPYCLLVDEVLGKQEVVIKSLGETLKNVPGIAGGAILGDGRVGLILDMDGVFKG